jgi:23S rRNA pseudouridine1911/1915/1917 synthase
MKLRLDDSDEGLRLDQVLAARIPELSRRKARVLIDLGGVFIDGRRCKQAGRLMRKGEQVEAHLGGALERATGRVGTAARAADEARLAAFSIVHEDEELVVVDKPAGLLTAPTPESDRGNLLALLERRFTPRRRHFIVHRLDLPTSGLLVVAKTEDANRILSEKFRTHDLLREYLGVVAGRFPATLLRLDAAAAGRPALTHVTVEEALGEHATLLRFRLETGRTHQIRVHVTGVGHPILGDRSHGPGEPPGPPRAALPAPPRLALHATLLAFQHPRTGEALRFESPWPVDLMPWLDGLRALARAASANEG